MTYKYFRFSGEGRLSLDEVQREMAGVELVVVRIDLRDDKTEVVVGVSGDEPPPLTRFGTASQINEAELRVPRTQT
jgi:hypothetical protein